MKRTISTAVLILMVAGSAMAAPRYVNRRENQQDRIAQGVKIGSLTAKETAHLENKEVKLNNEVKTMRTLDNGKLTTADKKAINQQQNNLSRRIYDDKHNAAHQ